MTPTLKSQNWLIWRHLFAPRRPLTQGEALRRYGVARLASRIFDLRRDGWKIISERVTVKTRAGVAVIARYRMEA